MKDFDFYKSKLLDKYKEKNDDEMNERYEHSLNVSKFCGELVDKYNLDIDRDKAILTGLLHDYAKFYSLDEYKELVDEYNLDSYVLQSHKKILHSLLGGYAVKNDFGIDDEEILTAIEYHTTGKPDMTLLQKILFISDYCESGRIGQIYDKARELAFTSLDKCIFYILDSKIKHVLERGFPVDENTQKAFKFYKKAIKLYDNKLDNVLETINRNLVHDVMVYDLINRNPLYDYVIITTSNSQRQMDACISYLRDDFTIVGVEKGEGWTLIDLGDVILHIFSEDDREKYGLDKLYASYPIVENKIIL